jgi:hypothetical protein
VGENIFDEPYDISIDKMEECKNLHRCSFFTIRPENDAQELALAGFQRIYCRGSKREQCMRLIVGSQLGPEYIPMNMMPNGFPLNGTDDSDWSEELKEFIRNWRSK